MDFPLDEDAALAVELVRDAGRLAHRMRSQGVEVRHKTSASDLVTVADDAAEELLVSRLEAARPGDGIVGEEGTDRPGTSGRRWVIDPVDGTFNFVHGLEWWCAALALTVGEQVTLGAVHHPGEDVVWVGGAAMATTRNGAPMAPIVDRPLSDCSVATYIPPRQLHVPDVIEPFTAVASATKALRMVGSSSMSLAAVAEGRIDLWCQHGLPPWDWMPGHALVEGAGGAATQVEARGTTWFLAGAPSAVAEAADRLERV